MEKNKLILTLAPMAGYTDRDFRRICGEMGADFAVTEMVSAKALCYEQIGKHKSEPKSAALAHIEPGIPTAVQLFGCDPEFIARAVELIAVGNYRGCEYGQGGQRPTAIDINMGCPVKKVVSNGEGSALMKNPELAGRIVEAAVRASDIPITVKMRAGWDENSINAPELARVVEQAGASMVCVHARTREQFYEPAPDISVIGRVKAAVSIPVIGNGGVFSADDAMRMLDETGCDGIALARGALGNPWLFAEIRARHEGREYTPPTVAERMETAMLQVTELMKRKGERGITEARSQLAFYLKGFKGAASLRARINTVSTAEELRDILDSAVREENDG